MVGKCSEYVKKETYKKTSIQDLTVEKLLHHKQVDEVTASLTVSSNEKIYFRMEVF